MSNATISTTITNGKLHLEFADHTSITIGGDELAHEIRVAAMLHGLKQKLCDAAAIARNTETGRSATLADKKAAVMAVYERLTGPNPSWNVVARGGESEGGLLLRALIQLKPDTDRTKLTAWLAGKTKSEQAALRARPDIAAIIETLRPKADPAASASLLDELAGL